MSRDRSRRAWGATQARDATRARVARRAASASRAVLPLAVVAAALLLAGCGDNVPSILRSEGSQGNEIVTLAIWVFAILSVVAVVVWGLLAYVIIRFRRRPESEASQTHGNLKIEIVWTAIPAVIVTVLFILTVQTTEQIAMPDRGAQFTAIGRQWWWEFRFKELGFETANEVYVPVDRLTSIDVRSADVIHSFWVPQMGGKVDMIPGRTNHIRFTPLSEGEYLGECSEFCGAQHGKMRFLFVVASTGEYSDWVRDQQRPAARPTSAAAKSGEAVIKSVGCGSCHAVRGTGLSGDFGPDLTHFGSRRGIAAYSLRNTPENLLRWLEDPHAIKPECLMPRVPLPQNQYEDLVAYLGELQ